MWGRDRMRERDQKWVKMNRKEWDGDEKTSEKKREQEIEKEIQGRQGG